MLGPPALGQKSKIYPKIHLFEISFFAKFTFLKSHFSQNSHFWNFIFHKIHIFEITFFTFFKILFFTKFTFPSPNRRSSFFTPTYKMREWGCSSISFLRGRVDITVKTWEFTSIGLSYQDRPNSLHRNEYTFFGGPTLGQKTHF